MLLVAAFRRLLLEAPPLVGGELHIKLTKDMPRADFLGIYDYDENLVNKVRDNNFPGVSFEGIVAKGLIKKQLVMYKAKTQDWI